MLARTIVTLLFCSLAHAQGPATTDSADMNKKAADVPPTANNPVEKPAVPVKGSVKMANVRFLEPKEGATVDKTFHMKFAVQGLKVAPAGPITPGTGHYHIIVDGAPLKEGVVVPSDAKNIHYGKGQTDADLTLPSGPHTLTLQFADGAHRSYGEILAQTIHITVK